MGNSLGGKKSAKVMKISGETQKVKVPVRAGSVIDTCPGHVLLDSQAVKQYGLRATPLEPEQELKPGRVYFLIQLPKNDDNRVGARRVRSGIHVGAKERLESLMLARRSASDLSAPPPPPPADQVGVPGGVRVRMRLPKAEVERLMAESNDGADVAEKIAKFYVAAKGGGSDGDGAAVKRSVKSREKRVGFMPITDREIHQLTAAS
ncbi:hypothetical protin [Striga asiatica]|uniref:Hypothetical protin n=1 Tax=Striga asiatica TaxID=4170 RepID=A0A5A7QV73_STRAF|nr:hypothetical protin [Striga asiatica]